MDEGGEPVLEPSSLYHITLTSQVHSLWRQVGTARGLTSDNDIAAFLLHHYEDTLSGRQNLVYCTSCNAALSLACWHCKENNPAGSSSTQNISRNCKLADNQEHQPAPGDSRSQEELRQYIAEQIQQQEVRVQQQLDDPPAQQPSEEGNAHQSAAQPEEALNGVTSKKRGKGSKPRLNPLAKRKSGKSNQPALCTECGVTISRASDMKAHLRIHTGEKPFVCSLCTRAFNQKSALRRHLRNHKNYALIACPDCSEMFNRCEELERHLRISCQGHFQFACCLCNESFQSLANLQAHSATHTAKEWKPFNKEIGEEKNAQREPPHQQQVEQQNKSEGGAAWLSKSHQNQQSDLGPDFSQSPEASSENEDEEDDEQQEEDGNGEPTDFQPQGVVMEQFLQGQNYPQPSQLVVDGATESLHHQTAQLHTNPTEESPLFQETAQLPSSQEQILGTNLEQTQMLASDQTYYQHADPRLGSNSFTQETSNQGSTVGNTSADTSEPQGGRPKRKVRESDMPTSCPECNVRISRARDLKVHMRVHTGERPFQCRLCQRAFTQKSALNTHMKIHNPDRCPQPRREYVYTDKVRWNSVARCVRPKETEEEESVKGSQKMDEAPKGTNQAMDQNGKETPEAQNEGQQRENSDQEQSEEEHEDDQELPHHFLSSEQQPANDQGDKRNKCDEPSRKRLKRDSKNQGNKSGSDKNDAQSMDQLILEASSGVRRRRPGRHPKDTSDSVDCPVCGVTISRRRSLKIHMRVHSDEKPHLCSECGMEFRQPGSLVAHMRKHRNERPFVCHVCAASFPLLGSLNVHLRTHAIVKPFSCEECHRRFCRASDLKTHMARHLGLKEHACSMCDRSFVTSSELTRHVRLHTGEKPYACSMCQKRFRLKKTLVEHERTHTKDKPYLCVTCGKSFAHISSYATHCRLHTGERPYQCPACPKAFPSSGNLTQHMWNKHQLVGGNSSETGS